MQKYIKVKIYNIYINKNNHKRLLQKLGYSNMKWTEKEFLEYFKKYIPTKHRTDAEANYTYNNLHTMLEHRITFLDKKRLEEYEKELLSESEGRVL